MSIGKWLKGLFGACPCDILKGENMELMEGVKICSKCGHIKTLSSFSKHSGMKDGYQYNCKECRTTIQKEYRNTAVGKLKQKKFWGSNSFKQTMKKYFSSPEGKMRRYARGVVANNVKRGILKKLPCAVCGCEIVEAHHEDYNNPLEVVWFCREHHTEYHMRINKCS